MEKSTRNIFILKSKIIHKNFYDYNNVIYVNNATKVEIICPIHGSFFQRPLNHLKGQKCKKCYVESKKNKLIDIIHRFKLIHIDKYDYSLVLYKNINSKVNIICKKHGIFVQTPSNHLKGQGCMKCKLENQTLSLNEFIEKSNKIHNFKYSYLKTIYINNHINTIITCSIHGDFSQRPDSHLSGKGCPTCNESYGEKEISILLQKENIKYIRQHKFCDCRDKNSLPFDFYLPEYNICIEFDGLQHFEPIGFFGGEKSLKLLKNRDNIKTEYCKNNNMFIKI